MYGEVYCSYEDITQVTGRLKAAVARRVVKTTEPLGRGMLKTYQCGGLKLEIFFSFYRPAQTVKFTKLLNILTTIITMIMVIWTIKTFGGMPTWGVCKLMRGR